MEKRKGFCLAAAILLLLSLAALSGAAYLAAAGATGTPSAAAGTGGAADTPGTAAYYAACSAAPIVSLDREALSMRAGNVEQIKISVTGSQPARCGIKQYGVDFTNGYDAQNFELALLGSQQRNVFYLSPGQTKEFAGIIGAKPGAEAGNYTIQVTGYLESDHWKQASKSISVHTGKRADSDTMWKTQLQIGWNAVPYVSGIGAFGCPDITTAYRYSPSLGDYVVMQRYGAVFVSSAQSEMANEKFSGLFVFATSRCTIESSVPPSAFNATINANGGQLLSMPPAWQGENASGIIAWCSSFKPGGNGTMGISHWDARSQKWIPAAVNGTFYNGEVLKVGSSFDCPLRMDRAWNASTGSMD